MMIMEHRSEKCLNKCMVKRRFAGMKRNLVLVGFPFGGVSLW